MSERSSSVPAASRRTLKAPAAALARVREVVPIEPAAAPRLAVQHVPTNHRKSRSRAIAAAHAEVREQSRGAADGSL